MEESSNEPRQEPMEEVRGDDANNDDDLLDETPAFLNPEDAVEVQVDDNDVPMDEDDAEEEGMADEKDMTDAASGPPVPDMSVVKIDSHSGPVYTVASQILPSLSTTGSSNMCIVASGGGDDKAFLHRIASGSDGRPRVETLPLAHAHTDSVSCVTFNIPFITPSDPQASAPNQVETPRLVAVGGYDGAIVLYNVDNGQIYQTQEGPTDVEWLCFHPKGGTVLLAGSAADGTIWMYNILLNKCLQVFVGHESAVTAGSFTPDGKFALSASSDGTVRLWAPRKGTIKHVFRFPSLDGETVAGLTSMAVNGGLDGQLVIVGAEDGQAHVCHTGTKKVVASLRHYEIPSNIPEDDQLELPISVEAVGFAAKDVNPNWCATGGVDGVLKIWDLANNGQCRQVCRIAPEPQDTVENQVDAPNASPGGITRLQWHPALPVVFTSATDGAVYIWDARNGRLLQKVTGNADVVNAMSISFLEDGTRAVIVSGSDDQSVRMFEVDLKALLQTTAVSGAGN